MTQRSRRGFSLLELAVVLALLSLLVGFGVNIGQNAVKSTSRLAMLEKMALIKQALDNYGNRNGYLPCPADPQLLPSNIAYGAENRGATPGSNCTTSGGVFSVPNAWLGMIPVQSLGLDDSYSLDAWGNKLTYAVSTNHTGTSGVNLGFGSYTTQPATLTVNSNVVAVPITLTSTPAGVPGAGATYVVVSHGKNGRGAFAMNSTAANTCTAGFIDTQNCDRTDSTFFDSAYNEGAQATTQFDDYIVWGTNKDALKPSDFLPNACPEYTPGVKTCESWCAPCETSGQSTAPTLNPARLCAKFITRNLPSCEARCIWSTNAAAPTIAMPCP